LPGGARNLGLQRAVGKHISFIDSDDWIDTNFLHFMVQSIEKSGACLAVSGVKREYSNAKSSSIRYQYNVENVIDGKFALSLLCRSVDQDISISAIVCNKLFRGDFLRTANVRFIDNSYNEDDVFMFEALLKAQRVSLTDWTYYHLFQRRDSASRKFGKKHIDDLFLAFSTIRVRLTAAGQFDANKLHYYAFFEKCLGYLIESIRMSEQDDEVVRNHFKYAFSICREAISLNEFVDYCGARRIEEFFCLR
jgi:glycosyltransferase involved in cell wall biosynthesis